LPSPRRRSPCVIPLCCITTRASCIRSDSIR
jgi:hypothetical protein